MENVRIVEILKSQYGITDVDLDIKKDEGNGVTWHEGHMNISNLKGMYSFRETPVMDILKISYIFEFTLIKKEKKESIYEIINIFNQTKIGIKATLNSFSKGLKLSILFSSEILTAPKSDLLKESLTIVTPVISAGAILFGSDLSSRKINHKPITR